MRVCWKAGGQDPFPGKFPAGIYLLKVNKKTPLKQDVKYVQSWQ